MSSIELRPLLTVSDHHVHQYWPLCPAALYRYWHLPRRQRRIMEAFPTAKEMYHITNHILRFFACWVTFHAFVVVCWIFSKKYFRNTIRLIVFLKYIIRVSIRLDPDQNWHLQTVWTQIRTDRIIRRRQKSPLARKDLSTQRASNKIKYFWITSMQTYLHAGKLCMKSHPLLFFKINLFKNPGI